MFNPLVSIVLPVYNGSNYLREAIDSAIAQTYKNIEIIIVNDGSIDDTEVIISSYGDKVRYFSKKNNGVASALNLAIREMKGEYFSWLSHDDLYLPEKIQKQIEYLNLLKKKNVILYSNYAYINEKSKIIRTVKLDHDLLEINKEYALFRGFLNGCTILIPKKAFDEYGFFDEKLRCTQDYDMWNRIMKTYDFIHMPQILVRYRVHSLQDSKKNPRAIIEGNSLYIKMMKELSPNRKKELEGDELEFYKQMVFYLKQTPYAKAMKFANDKANEFLIKEKKPIIDFTNKLVIPNGNEFNNKIKFALFSPKKFFKKYIFKFK